MLEFAALVTEELTQALLRFWETSSAILGDSGVRLKSPPSGYVDLENNFFSALFLYSYIRRGIPKARRAYYAVANQCLRGMVTGCDNILDDEYKKTLHTDLPESAVKFRSVLDIMVADRVLSRIMLEGFKAGDFTWDQVLAADRASLHALLKSGAQEAGEEMGVDRILPPDIILSQIHSLKTGLLFQAPWVLPETLDGFSPGDDIRQGLFRIGLGCQVMDDMVDLARDIPAKRHNYLVSLIWHLGPEEERARLNVVLKAGTPGEPVLPEHFQTSLESAAKKAVELLELGCGLLFAPEHKSMIPLAVQFFAGRIGADRFMERHP